MSNADPITRYDLGKWPRLLVVGEPVTEQQAREILIRTMQPAYLFSNDKEWQLTCQRTLGFPEGEYWPPHGSPEEKDVQLRLAWFKARWDAQNKRSEELGIIPLEYLYNSHVMSSWLGGSHGWCDWTGTIGTSSYNVGKWPSHEDITEEWQRIAEAFPFLSLKCQLVSEEGEGVVAGQWRVEGGAVTEESPGAMLPKEDLQADTILAHLAHLDYFERGVSLPLLQLAVQEVEAKMAAITAQEKKEIES